MARTRAELAAENLVLYRELEQIRHRLDELLEDNETLDDPDADEDETNDSEELDAEDED